MANQIKSIFRIGESRSARHTPGDFPALPRAPAAAREATLLPHKCPAVSLLDRREIQRGTGGGGWGVLLSVIQCLIGEALPPVGRGGREYAHVFADGIVGAALGGASGFRQSVAGGVGVRCGEASGGRWADRGGMVGQAGCRRRVKVRGRRMTTRRSLVLLSSTTRSTLHPPALPRPPITCTHSRGRAENSSGVLMCPPARRCKPKKCGQECMKYCPVVRMGERRRRRPVLPSATPASMEGGTAGANRRRRRGQGGMRHSRGRRDVASVGSIRCCVAACLGVGLLSGLLVCSVEPMRWFLFVGVETAQAAGMCYRQVSGSLAHVANADR